MIGCRVALPHSYWSAVPTPLFIYIYQLFRDSFSVSQQPPIWEPPSHYSMLGGGDSLDPHYLQSLHKTDDDKTYLHFGKQSYVEIDPKYQVQRQENILPLESPLKQHIAMPSGDGVASILPGSVSLLRSPSRARTQTPVEWSSPPRPHHPLYNC